jgi:solute carrier family 45 protein 1/2/4
MVCSFPWFIHSAAVCERSFFLGIASPYLLSLGLTKSKVATVFIAGPLSGLIMQPLIGTFTRRIPSCLNQAC